MKGKKERKKKEGEKEEYESQERERGSVWASLALAVLEFFVLSVSPQTARARVRPQTLTADRSSCDQFMLSVYLSTTYLIASSSGFILDCSVLDASPGSIPTKRHRHANERRSHWGRGHCSDRQRELLDWNNCFFDERFRPPYWEFLQGSIGRVAAAKSCEGNWLSLYVQEPKVYTVQRTQYGDYVPRCTGVGRGNLLNCLHSTE